MTIAGRYSFNDGHKAVKSRYPRLLKEVEDVIASVRAPRCRTKTSKEKTMPGARLYSPIALNKAFKAGFTRKGWKTVRVQCDYPTKFYEPGYSPPELNKGAFREMDFVKRQLGIEVQFGKYAFMVYNVCAKMTIFRNLGHIDTGIEIVPMKDFVNDMSSGVSYFEQFVWDLEPRGVSNIDIPVLVLGVAK